MNYCRGGSRVCCPSRFGAPGLVSSGCHSAVGTTCSPAPELDLLQLELIIYQENANPSTVVRTSASFVSSRFSVLKN